MGDARWLCQNYSTRSIHRLKPKPKANESLVYLANALDEAEGILWIDFNHLTPIGNQVIADAIFEVIEPIITQ